MGKRINVIGNRFGMLTVLSEAEPKRVKERAMLRCVNVICDCGTRKIVTLRDVRCGDTKSCGCLNRIKKPNNIRKHPLYRVWNSIINRCTKRKDRDYAYYGERGITVCDEWRSSYAAFYEWALTHGWVRGLHTDRIDNDGPYAPWNCRFVTSAVNVRNGRVTKLNKYDVHNIRYLASRRISQDTIARMYAMGQTAISSIVTGKTWKEV